jgi:hypothetical protein
MNKQISQTHAVIIDTFSRDVRIILDEAFVGYSLEVRYCNLPQKHSPTTSPPLKKSLSPLQNKTKFKHTLINNFTDSADSESSSLSLDLSELKPQKTTIKCTASLPVDKKVVKGPRGRPSKTTTAVGAGQKKYQPDQF